MNDKITGWSEALVSPSKRFTLTFDTPPPNKFECTEIKDKWHTFVSKILNLKFEVLIEQESPFKVGELYEIEYGS